MRLGCVGYWLYQKYIIMVNDLRRVHNHYTFLTMTDYILQNFNFYSLIYYCVCFNY